MVSHEGLVSAAEAALTQRFGPVRLTEPVTLSSSSRSTVIRATLTGSPIRDAPGSVIVKTHDLDLAPEAAVREPAALDVIAGLVDPPGPSLLAVTEHPALVVLSDLGDHGRVSDSLLWGTAATATDALSGWAETMGRLHAQAAGCGPDFADALRRHAARLDRPAPPTDRTPEMLRQAVADLSERLPALGVHVTDGAIDELLSIEGRLDQSVSLRALTPSDACPDNNLLGDERLRLIDFEGAQVRHVAWDVAYLTVPWPSCWCSWRIPDQVADLARTRWQAAAALDLDLDRFEADLRLTTIGWCLVSIGWFLPRAIDDHPWYDDPELNKLAPPRRALIANRLTLIERFQDPRVPQLNSLAAKASAAVRAAWGDLELPLAPAWR